MTIDKNIPFEYAQLHFSL